MAHKGELGIKSCTLQGYKHRKAYIIAEGPMASTVRNMWKVIYDKKCGAIVMLSQCNENEMVRLCNLRSSAGHSYAIIWFMFVIK